MRTCSAARTGDSQSFQPEVKNSFLWGSPIGRWVEGEEKGGKLGTLNFG